MLTTINNILLQKPELEPLVKFAEDWSSLPCSNKEQTAFSAILAGYLEKQALAWDAPEHVKRAVAVFGINQKSVDKTVQEIVAKNLPQEVQRADSHLKAAELLCFEKSASELKQFAEEFSYTFEDPILKLKSGQGEFMKQAAIESLEARRAAFSCAEVDGLLEGLYKCSEVISGGFAADFTELMGALDAKIGYSQIGFNFAKEAGRRTSLAVKVGNKKVPVESLISLGDKRLSQIVGAPVSTKDLVELKAVIESLPSDVHNLLGRYV